MKNSKSTVSCIVVSGVAIAWVLFSFKHSTHYFAAPLHSIATLFCAIFISYQLTQALNNKRRAQDAVEKLLCKIEAKILDDSLLDFGTDIDTKQILLRNRYINNKITAIQSYASILGFEEYSNTLKASFVEYEETVGEHIEDNLYLSKSLTTFKRNIDKVDAAIEDIRFHMFKP